MEKRLLDYASELHFLDKQHISQFPTKGKRVVSDTTSLALSLHNLPPQRIYFHLQPNTHFHKYYSVLEDVLLKSKKGTCVYIIDCDRPTPIPLFSFTQLQYLNDVGDIEEEVCLALSPSYIVDFAQMENIVRKVKTVNVWITWDVSHAFQFVYDQRYTIQSRDDLAFFNFMCQLVSFDQREIVKVVINDHKWFRV